MKVMNNVMISGGIKRRTMMSETETEGEETENWLKRESNMEGNGEENVISGKDGEGENWSKSDIKSMTE